MASWKKLLAKARRSPANLRFSEVCSLAEKAGFVQRKSSGTSHRVYKHPAIQDALASLCNFQDDDGNAKAYQVRQLLGRIDEYQLGPANDGEPDEP